MCNVSEEIEVTYFQEREKDYLLIYRRNGAPRNRRIEKDSECPSLEEIKGPFCQQYALNMAVKIEQMRDAGIMDRPADTLLDDPKTIAKKVSKEVVGVFKSFSNL